MRAEVRVVNEAELDLCRQVFGHERPQQAQAERVPQRPPQAFDQRDRVGVLPSSERNARAFISARAFKPRLTLIGS